MTRRGRQIHTPRPGWAEIGSDAWALLGADGLPVAPAAYLYGPERRHAVLRAWGWPYVAFHGLDYAQEAAELYQWRRPEPLPEMAYEIDTTRRLRLHALEEQAIARDLFG